MMPTIPLSFETNSSTRVVLPPDDPRRRELYEEVHACPTARIPLPALVVHVAVLNEGVSRDSELQHLRLLPGQQALQSEQLAGDFLHLSLPEGTLRWERHSEFTRYALIQPVAAEVLEGACDPELLPSLIIDPEWLRQIPGRTLAAVQLVMLVGSVDEADAPLQRAQYWFGEQTVVASLLGEERHSWVATDFRLHPTGFVRMLVIASPGTSETRAGRIAARLIELEDYRMLALRGLPVAKSLQDMLGQAERTLADLTSSMEQEERSAQDLRAVLEALAARIEHATARHGNCLAATTAYHTLVCARLAELHENAVSGTQSIGELLHDALCPAMATVQATADRLASLSQRIERAGALLRTRVDIARVAQNQQLLAKFAREQQMQLHLQRTVEGLSFAAISYYAVSLLLYAAEAAKAAGLPVHPELAAGVLIPVVLYGVWHVIRRIHARLDPHD